MTASDFRRLALAMPGAAEEIFSAVPGGWGKMGSTRVLLPKVKPDVLDGALRMSWTRRSQKNTSKRKAAKK